MEGDGGAGAGHLALMRRLSDWVKQHMCGNDPSHDFAHVERVMRLALAIAKEENAAGEQVDLELVEIASLLHDVADWKYSGSEEAGPEAIRHILEKEGGQLFPPQRIESVIAIVTGIGFKNELEQLNSNTKSETADHEKPKIPTELAIVQDADRLDAIGAIGIARTFSYGAKKRTAFYDPNIPPRPFLTKQTYMDSVPTTTLNHFDEKLFKLKDLMKTATGRRMAQKRHDFMVAFVEEFMREYNGCTPNKE
jgi:uncharacterized protein